MTYLPVDVIVDQKGKQKHRIDTLNLLAYVILLILVLVTTWFFKRRRKARLYVHETGLAIIYGMIMGAGLRYFGLEIKISSPTLEYTVPISEPADYYIVEARNLGDKLANQTHQYAYEFRGELQRGTSLGSQISYATVDPEIFFNLILPPIVLNAGLSLKRRHFFRNIGAIFSYAFLGTTISVAFVGSFIYGSIQIMKIFLGYSYLADQFSLANCLYFGAIISPTDPIAVLAIFQELGVDVNLFALVFGESILNDAVSIVLTHSIDQFSIIYGSNPYYPVYLIILKCISNFMQMFVTSCLIGILFGIVSALTTKFTKLSETPLLETSLVVLMSYSSFLTAEVIDASGIVAILLCGITQAHYTINNLSFEARERLKSLFELLTFLCENFLFLAVGVAFWQRGQNWNLSFVGIAFVAVTIARAISIYPLTCLLNLGRRQKIPINYQHIIAWGGAARGVISYSLAAKNTVGDARRIMLSTTSVIVIFSVIVVGGTVDLMLRCLRIPFHGDHRPLVNATDDDDPQETKRRLQQPHDVQPTPIVEVESIWSGERGGRRQRENCVPNIYNHGLTNHGETSAMITTTNSLLNRTASSSSSYSGDALASKPDELNVSAAAVAFESSKQAQLVKKLASDSNEEVARNLANGDAFNENAAKNPRLTKIVATTASSNFEQQQQQLQQSSSGNLLLALEQSTAQNSIDNGNGNNANFTTFERPYENASIVRCWRNVDNNFIKPLLTNSHPTLMETLPTSLRVLARLFTSNEQLMRRQSIRN